MEQELVALAQSGAAVVVGAMATDLWNSVRDGALAVFRRSGRDRELAAEARLDHGAALVAQDADPDEVRRALFGLWVRELTAVLRDSPSARAELDRLVAGFGGERRGDVFEQTNTAYGSGTVNAVQRGEQRVYTRPQPED